MSAISLMINMKSLLAINNSDYLGTLGHDDDGERFIFTKSYDGPIKNRRMDREYCSISRECYSMLPGLEKAVLDPSEDDDEGDEIVVGLERLHNNGNPRLWMDWVIYYSIQERFVDSEDVDDCMFFGIAIYSHFYRMRGRWLDTLIDNMLRLYIERAILSGGFHGRIYTKQFAEAFYHSLYHSFDLLEDVMKNALISILKRFGILIGIEGDDLKTFPHENTAITKCLEERSARMISNGENSAVFKNVVVKDQSLDSIVIPENITIIFTLISMVRSRKHRISATCREWLDMEDFGDVLRLFGERSVGVTDLEDRMDMQKMLGGVVTRLNYLEVSFDNHQEQIERAVEFIDGLDNETEIVIITYDFDALIKRHLALCTSRINNARVSRIIIVHAPMCLADQSTVELLAGNEDIRELELCNCGITLEELLKKDYFRLLKDKLTVLGVCGIGNLSEEKMPGGGISDDILSGTRIERLNIAIKEGDRPSDLNRLADRGLKYLFFHEVNGANVQKIIDLKKSLGTRKWPVIIANFEPQGADYARIGKRFYEIY